MAVNYEVNPECKFLRPVKKTKAISKKYLLHCLQRFAGYFSTVTIVIEAFVLVQQRLYTCVIGVYHNAWDHEVIVVTTSPSLSERFPAYGRRFRAAVSETSGGNDQRFQKLPPRGITEPA